MKDHTFIIQLFSCIDPRSQLNNSRSNVSESAISQIPSSSSIPCEPAHSYSQPVPVTDTNRHFSIAIQKALTFFPNLVPDVDQFNP